MRSPLLMLLPVMLMAQRSAPTPAEAFDRELKKNRLGTWLVLEDEGATWGTRARAAMQEDPLVALNLPLYVVGGKRADAMSTYLRDRFGWVRGGHWALLDSAGRVLVDGASLPNSVTLGLAAERAGLKSRAQELTDFLRRNSDHLEAKVALLRERIATASRRTQKVVGSLDAKPNQEGEDGRLPEPVQLDAENDLKIWAESAQLLDRLFQGPWLEVSSDLPWALNGAEAAHSPTMRTLWVRHLPAVEEALRRQPNAWDLWRIWILGADLSGGRSLAPLLDSLEPLPGTAPEDWPPAAVLEAFVRDAKKRHDWRAIREAMEPRWEEWRLDTRRSAMGQGPGERIWSRVLQPLIEALLALGDAGTADQIVLQAIDVLRWDGVASQARDLALRLNRQDLAIRWGGLSQARSR